MRELTASDTSAPAASALADSDALVHADTLALLDQQFRAADVCERVGGVVCHKHVPG